MSFASASAQPHPLRRVGTLGLFLWLLVFIRIHVFAQELRFLSPTEAGPILARRDAYRERLSDFDRSAKLKTNTPVSTEEFVRRLAASVREWSPGDRQRITEAFESIRDGLKRSGAPLPPLIRFIHTTGDVEGNAPYTRSDAIFLPTRSLGRPMPALSRLLAHEVFHIISRSHPELRDRLYACIGFLPCGEVVHPADLKALRITNPDAPINAHAIRIEVDGSPVWGVPILYGSGPYDPARGGEFFAYLQLRLLLVDRTEAGGHRVLTGGAGARLIEVESAKGFYEQVGRNTGYVLHPEETVADHFAMIVAGDTGVKSPEVLERIREVLKLAH